MPELPTGTVTFLFTDVEGSTRLIEELGEEGYVEALAWHRGALREAFGAEGGVEVDTQGDAFLYAFADAAAALAAAVQGQQALASGPVRVRMGMHTGEALLSGEGYAGRELHRAARIVAAGHGGQVVVSAASAALAGGELSELGEHRLKDFPEPVALFQLGEEAFPPLRTISNTNLPSPASSFVGREHELEELCALLRDGARLVTLSGPGGTGKTRLAIEAAAELVPAFTAGVFWVPLATLRDPALVAETIAQTLGAKNGLAQEIGERELLLLLDNFEQVVSAAPELTPLLEACPNLKLLVTSRELLRIRGEREYPVPPLHEREAIELFCARSRLEPDETIAELCRRLDELPLALELAAARTSVVTPAQILARLAKRLDLLKGGRDAEARQQTLRATIAWSYELLDQAEQQLFARLAVFRGGCTLEAAEQVAEADLDTLQSLVDKSLLRRTGERFWLLETIHQYAQDLAADGEHAGLLCRHASWCLEFAESADRAEEKGGDTAAFLDHMAAEHDNLRRALEWARDTGADELLLRLVAALGGYWSMRGLHHEARLWLPLAFERGSAPPRARLRVLGAAALVAMGDRDLARAQALNEERHREAEQAGDEQQLLAALTMEAILAAESGDLEGARAALLEVRARAARAGNRDRVARTTTNLGVVAIEAGDFRAGLEYSLEALELWPELGDDSGVAVALENCGWSALALDPARAEDFFGQALSVAGRLGAPRRIASGSLGLGAALVAQHREQEGAQLLGAAAAFRDELEIDFGDEHERQTHEAAVAAATAALGEAAFAAAWARGQAMTPEEIVQLNGKPIE